MRDTVSLVFEWLHQAEIHDARAEASIQGADAEAAVKLPPRRQLVAGGGSLAATGMLMSLTQNHDAARCAEPEFVQLLAWFKAETGTDSGVVAKSWGNVTWDRPVVDKSRAFTVQRPWRGIVVAGHVLEVYKATVNDHSGLRQRLFVLDPDDVLWLALDGIDAHSQRLPVESHDPAQCLASLLFPVLLWSVKTKDF